MQLNDYSKHPEYFSKISAGGRVVIPAELREKLALKPGDDLVFEDTDEGIRLTTRHIRALQAMRYLQERFKGVDYSVDEFLAERRLEAKKEQDEIDNL